MGPALATALIGGFFATIVALITVIGGALVQRRATRNAPADTVEGDLDVLHAMSSLVGQQDDRIRDLQQQLADERIRRAECEARESARERRE